MPRCAIYARFSSDRQSAKSAEDQIALCVAHAERQGYEVVDVYSDAAISGTSNRRPGMTAMLSAASAGAYDIVLAEALDRVSRNQADIATFYQRLEFAGVAMETVSEGKISELHIGLKGTMSALFLKDLGDKIRRGQRGAVARGRVPGGLTYGYKVVHQLDARGQVEGGLREIDPDQAAIVRRIYDEYLAGVSPKKIAHRLNADHVPSPRGGEWQASTIYGNAKRAIGILRNPIYSGRYLYNRVSMKLDPDTRRRLSRENPSDERVWVDMPHLRIVDQATWDEVQASTERRAQRILTERKRPRNLLTGMVRCGSCGGSISVVTSNKMGCVRAREKGTCDMRRMIRREVLEDRVVAGITNRLLEPDAVSRLVKRYHEAMAEQQQELNRETDALDRQIAKLDRVIERLVVAIGEGAVDFREIREALQARREDRDSLIRKRQEVAADSVIALNPEIVVEYRKRIRSLTRHLRTDTPEAARVIEVVRDIVEGVIITPRNDDAWSIEMTSSLGSVVALATQTARPPKSGSAGTATVVAKDRNQRGSTFRSVRI